MTTPLLSICIATYNRADYIGETLESIIPQLTDRVEIIIVDGASTDRTESVVAGYIQTCQQISYLRLPTKGGVDQDFCKAVELAKGEYCWLMSDDDLLRRGAIKAVLDEARRNDYSLIIVNSEVRNRDLSKVIDKKRLQIDRNRIYTTEENEYLFLDTVSYLSFIGCVVINRRLWNAREKEKYFGSSFIHVGVIFQSAIPSKVLVIAEPYITIRYGNAEWTARSFEIWMFSWPNLIWSFTGFSDKAKSQIVRREPYRRFLTLLLYRARGAYALSDYVNSIAPRLGPGWKRSVSRAIACLPGCFTNLLGVLYYSFFYRASRMPLMDMKNSRFYWAKCLRLPMNPKGIAGGEPSGRRTTSPPEDHEAAAVGP